MVDTGPNASTSCDAVDAKGFSFNNNKGLMNAPLFASASIVSTLSKLP